MRFVFSVPVRGCAAVFTVLSIFSLSLFSAGVAAQTTDASGRQLDEIMVVAQKKGRAENLQDVPQSITAFTGAQLDARFFQNLTGLSYTVPNVQMEEVGTFPGVQNFSIRGQGINSSIPSVDPTVGVFIDGVYMGTTFGTIIDMWDLESVEILRGPQGLLFGRNVTGGAVTVRTKRPDVDGDFGVRARASGANEQNYNAAFAVEGAFVPGKFAGKLMVSYNDDGGYFANTNNKVSFPPVPPAPVPRPPANDPPNFYLNPATGRNVGQIETTVVRPTLVWQATDALEMALIGEHGEMEGDGAPWTNVSRQRDDGSAIAGGTLPGLGSLDNFTTQSDEMGATDIKWDQVTFDLNWDVGPGTITNIAGWRKVSADSTADVDGERLPLFAVPGLTDQKQFSNELRYAATLQDVWDLTVGVYYLDQDIEYREQRYIQGGAALPSPPFPVFPDTKPIRLGGDMNAKNYGIFWNNDIRFADVWTATVGVRYSKEKKEASIIDGQCLDLDDSDSLCTFDNSDGEWDNWIPKLGLQWDFLENGSSSANVYGFWTKGFRAGGFNFRNAKPTVLPAGPTEQEEQSVWEIGIKSQFWDGRSRLNIAYFNTDIQDMQREVNTPDLDVAVLQGTINAGDVTIKGVELDFAVLVTDNLTIEVSGGYMDGKYTEINPMWSGINPGTGDPWIGDDLPRLSPWNFYTAGSYDIPLANTSLLNLRLDYGVRDRNAYNDSNTQYFDKQKRLNAAVSWVSPEDSWRVSLFGKNLNDQENWGNLTEVPDPASCANPYVCNPTGPTGSYVAGPMLKGIQYGIEVQYKL
jgi:iron complex outermembrane receptor protein